MSPKWSIGGVPLFVNADSYKPETRLSEHIILDGDESIIHRFGYGNGVRQITGHLLDNPDDFATLESGYHNGTTMTLVSDQGTEGDYIIWTLNRKRIKDIKRTKPVWFVELELK